MIADTLLQKSSSKRGHNNFWVFTTDIERNYRLFKVCYVPATSTTFLAFFPVATNITNETNKAGSTSL